ncbi:transmembrane protein 106C isoform X2 [Sus scrofa]|uniref:Transmembrane protein 106C n=1 Tax=Sus scrofa TaxID=9823 RepID=A0A8D2CDN1_PIG|nr:transmembrane protein 106C isoform X2 [Sus scrofa]
MGSQHSAFAHPPSCKRRKADDRENFLAEREQEEAIAQFPYVEFTGRDSITCLTCQGTGYIPTEQVNELVALIPHSDQRLRPQRTKQYVLLSVLLCLLASGLVVFFLFPHSVLVDDDGIKVVKVTFNKQDSLVILAITVRLGLPFLGRAPSSLGLRTFTRVSSLALMQATLKIRNSNFYPVAVTSLSSQVQYMNTVVGSYLTSNVSLIPPRSEHLVNFTAKAEMGGPFSYVYFFCTLPDILVHNIVVFMRTSVKISYIGHMTQSSLETHHYVDCGANSTAV